MMKEFNINHFVKIKLNPQGELIYRDYHDKLGVATPKIIKDDAGYTQFSMWEAMQIFGDHIYMGCTMPFETRILIEDQYLK